MKKKMILTSAQAAEFVQDSMTVASGGFVGSAIPEALIRAMETRFLDTGHPRGITYFYAGSQGNRDGRGGGHLAGQGGIFYAQ